MDPNDIADVKSNYYVHLDPGLLTQSAAKKWLKAVDTTLDISKDIDVILKDGFILCQYVDFFNTIYKGIEFSTN